MRPDGAQEQEHAAGHPLRIGSPQHYLTLVCILPCLIQRESARHSNVHSPSHRVVFLSYLLFASHWLPLAAFSLGLHVTEIKTATQNGV